MTKVRENCGDFQTEETLGPLRIRPVDLQKSGDFIDGHTHSFDHVTFFLTGSFHVETFNPACECRHEYDFVAPSKMLIEKGIEHKITATSREGGKFICVYTHRDSEGEVSEENEHLQSYS